MLVERPKLRQVAMVFTALACAVGMGVGGSYVNQETDKQVSSEVASGEGFALTPLGRERFQVHVSYSVWSRKGREVESNAFERIRSITGCEIVEVSEKSNDLGNPGLSFEVTTSCS